MRWAARYAWPACCILALPMASAETLRCGSQLVNTGDRAFEVERRCGPPVQRDVLGYTLGPHGREELLIEEWVYGPRNGALKILTFQGNRLTNIESRRSR